MAFSFVYRGIRSEDLGIEIINVKRSILPSNNNNLIDIPSRSGKYYFSQEYDVKIFDIEIKIKVGSSLIDFQNNIKNIGNFLDSTDGLGEFSIDDEDGVVYYAVIDGNSDYSQVRYKGTGNIVFVVPNPYGEGLNEYEFEINNNSVNFARGSNAYKLDGSIKLNNDPRYEEMIYGNGITVEEGSVNLCNFNQSVFEPSEYDYNNCSIGLSNKYTYFLITNSLEVKTDSSYIREGITSKNFINVNPSNYYTVSFYAVANKSEVLELQIIEYDSSDLYVNATYKDCNVNDINGGLVRCFNTIFTNASTSKIKVAIVTKNRVYLIYWLSGLMIENKKYYTSFIGGGYVRNNETLTVPISGLKNNSMVRSGTIDFIFKRLNEVSGDYSALFDWGAYSADYSIDRIALYHGTLFSNGLRNFTFNIVVGSLGVNYNVSVILPSATIMGKYYYVCMRWEIDGEMKLDIYDYSNENWYSNNYVISSNVAPSLSGYSTAKLGYLTGYYVNAIFDNFRAIPQMLSDNEIINVVQSVRPFVMENDTYIKYTFDDILNKTDVYNVGSGICYPVFYIKFNGVCSYCKISNNSKFVKIVNSFVSGDYIVIDCKDNVVYKGSNLVVDMSYLTYDSEFFYLNKNDNVIDVDSDGDVSVSVKYIPRWL